MDVDIAYTDKYISVDRKLYVIVYSIIELSEYDVPDTDFLVWRQVPFISTYSMKVIIDGVIQLHASCSTI